MAESHSTSKVTSRFPKPDLKNFALNAVVVALVFIVGYLAYSLLQRHVLQPPVESARPGSLHGQVIQIDVLNGCGVRRAASRITTFLRDRGYDVVEIRNYKSFDIPQSLIIDRTGNLETARRVAYALGVKKKNVVQQINHDYFVDVSVIVGKDFNSLKAPQ